MKREKNNYVNRIEIFNKNVKGWKFVGKGYIINL